MITEAIVLAGGFGTRLREVVPDLPKPMADVQGRPFLEIVLGALQAQGVQRVVLSLGHLADKVVAHFGTRWHGIELVHEIETRPLGTGGAVAAALARCGAGPVLVVNGDTFVELDLAALDAAWRGDPVIVAREVPDTARYGRLTLDGDRVTGFAEKGAVGPGAINAGVYLLPTDLLREVTLDPPYSLEVDVLAAWLASRRFQVFVTHGRFIDIGVPADYRLAQTMDFGPAPGAAA